MTQRLVAIADDFIRAFFEFFPHAGSEKGYVEVDALPVVFDRERVAHLQSSLAATRQRLQRASSDPSLDADDRIDLAVLGAVADWTELWLGDLRMLDANPHAYVEASLESIETLRLREAGGERIVERCYAERLRGFRHNFAAAVHNLKAPVRLSARAAIAMASEGATELEHDAELAKKGTLVREALSDAVSALRELAAFLEAGLKKTAPFRPIGRACYERLLAADHGLREGVVHWQSEAERFLERTHALAEAPAPPPARRLEQHFSSAVSPAQVWAFFQSEIDLLRRSIGEYGIVTIPHGELVLAPSPMFVAAVHAGASYHPPPAFSHSHTGFFFVPRVPERLRRDDLDHFRVRFEQRTFLHLAAHEAFPGHHVQFLHAMDHPRAARKFRDFDIFVEGWAHYCEEMMWEEALRHEPGCPFPLRSLRFRALRVLTDSALHCGELSPTAAQRFMAARLGTNAGPWIAREVQRYAIGPGQALSYFVGKRIIEDLRAEAQAREGAGFELRRFHDRLLAEGSIPVQLCREKWRSSVSPPAPAT